MFRAQLEVTDAPTGFLSLVAVRYAFRNMPRAATLVNSGDLPAYPFRTDDWNDVR